MTTELTNDNNQPSTTRTCYEFLRHDCFNILTNSPYCIHSDTNGAMFVPGLPRPSAQKMPNHL